jgi:hypothetical protein
MNLIKNKYYWITKNLNKRCVAGKHYGLALYLIDKEKKKKDKLKIGWLWMIFHVKYVRLFRYRTIGWYF